LIQELLRVHKEKTGKYQKSVTDFVTTPFAIICVFNFHMQTMARISYVVFRDFSLYVANLGTNPGAVLVQFGANNLEKWCNLKDI
ncbi:MAG: hypothetical protein ACI4RI_03865, partial [Ruminococcus sp.]